MGGTKELSQGLNEAAYQLRMALGEPRQLRSREKVWTGRGGASLVTVLLRASFTHKLCLLVVTASLPKPMMSMTTYLAFLPAVEYKMNVIPFI